MRVSAVGVLHTVVEGCCGALAATHCLRMGVSIIVGRTSSVGWQPAALWCSWFCLVVYPPWPRRSHMGHSLVHVEHPASSCCWDM
jgi:hypothetical protein